MIKKYPNSKHKTQVSEWLQKQLKLKKDEDFYDMLKNYKAKLASIDSLFHPNGSRKNEEDVNNKSIMSFFSNNATTPEENNGEKNSKICKTSIQNEYLSIFNWQLTARLNYSPFNLASNQYHTSNTDMATTTNNIYVWTGNSSPVLSGTKSTNNAFLVCRTFTVTGTTLS
jgi:hypothetical protein